MIKGLDKLQRKLNDLQKRAEDLDGEHRVKMSELLSAEFMLACSRFESLDDLLTANGISVESQEDFEAIPDDDMDRIIQESTSYSSWQEMLQGATGQWAAKRLGL